MRGTLCDGLVTTQLGDSTAATVITWPFAVALKSQSDISTSIENHHHRGLFLDADLLLAPDTLGAIRPR